FVRFTTRPACSGFVKATAFPPTRILSGRMHCDLHSAGQCLAALVRRDHQPLTMGRAGFVESLLFWIRLICAEPILALLALEFSDQFAACRGISGQVLQQLSPLSIAFAARRACSQFAPNASAVPRSPTRAPRAIG